MSAAALNNKSYESEKVTDLEKFPDAQTDGQMRANFKNITIYILNHTYLRQKFIYQGKVVWGIHNNKN